MTIQRMIPRIAKILIVFPSWVWARNSSWVKVGIGNSSVPACRSSIAELCWITHCWYRGSNHADILPDISTSLRKKSFRSMTAKSRAAPLQFPFLTILYRRALVDPAAGWVPKCSLGFPLREIDSDVAKFSVIASSLKRSCLSRYMQIFTAWMT